MSKYTWHGWIQYNGEDVSIYEDVEFPVTEEEYRKIQDAIAAGRHLAGLDCYAELVEKLIAAFDRTDYLYIEKPDPDDYEDEEEYEEALQEFQEAWEGFDEQYVLEEATLYDPAEERDFRETFIGKYSPVLKEYAEEEEQGGAFEWEYSEDYDRCVEYTLTVEYDENGVITDICDITAEGLESEGVKSSTWSSCSPNYDLLADALAEELEIDLVGKGER